MSKPTREERLAEAEATARTKIEMQRRNLAAIQSQQRAAAKKARDLRRYAVGTLVEEAGLGAWSDADLAAVFAVLAKLADVPNPAALLEGLLADGCGSPGRSVDGFACQDGSVSAAH